MTPSEVAGYAYNPQTTILSNTDTLQAVKNPALGVVAANFWNSAGGTADLLQVNKSCSVISRETYNSISVGLSDPSQSLAGPGGVITVTLNRTGTLSSKDSEVTVVRTTPTIQFTANVSGARGKTIHATFSLAAAPVITSNLNMVGVTGSPLSYQIASDASGVTYGATGLPLGLSVNTTTGAITGTPTENGTYTATVSATNGSGRTGYATLTIQVGASLSNLSSTFGASTTWVCPANVTAVQVECWGAGGAGGSAYKPVSGNAFGGGGAGGSYAKKNSVSVVPGASYTISIGAGGVSAISPSLSTVSGGDSWFGSGSVTSCLAKGGAGGQTVISSGSGIVGSGGVGNSTGSVGDLFFAGGNGLVGQGSPTNTGGGGGGSAGISSVGGSAISYLGAAAVNGGGAGGNGKDSTGNGNGSQGGSPGGGGGGARGSSVGSQALGGTGGAGQVVLTVVGMANVPQTAFASWSDNAEVTSESVYKYAFGAVSKTSAPEKISSRITPTTLSLTAVVRTDDSKLVITPKSVSSLSGTWSATDPVISVVNAADQTGLETGLVRKVYSVERGIDSKRFLKLEAVYTP
jgi:hyaluronate lyase